MYVCMSAMAFQQADRQIKGTLTAPLSQVAKVCTCVSRCVCGCAWVCAACPEIAFVKILRSQLLLLLLLQLAIKKVCDAEE